jgi:hypothetical protein
MKEMLHNPHYASKWRAKKMNLLNKTTPWMVASLLTAASVFGQQDKCSPRQDKCQPCSVPCDFKEMMPGMPGYNAPSRINVCGNWDLYVDGSFIYWQVAQDNMAYALTNNNALVAATATDIAGNYVETDFTYQPGFKVTGGMNFDYDNWDSFVEYTRLHGSTDTSTNGPSAGSLLANWGSNHLLAKSQVFRSAWSTFKTNLDFVDWVLARSFFVGKDLTFHPMVGVRGAWITQSMSVHYRNPTTSGLSGSFDSNSTILGVYSSQDVYSRVHSWGVGPRVGLEGSWMLGQGIRFYGNGYADILYTKYKIQNKAVYTITSSGAGQTFAFTEKPGTVRTHLDLELGLGWGSYFDDNNWHIDLSAGYGFQVFFNQNMFRSSFDNTVVASGSATNGDMTIQGLTATVRIDF